MLQVARLAPTLLQSSADLVGGFFRERYDPGGGFSNRAGLPDLYYTSSGSKAGGARASTRTPRRYLAASAMATNWNSSYELLARCWAKKHEASRPPVRARLLEAWPIFRSATALRPEAAAEGARTGR